MKVAEPFILQGRVELPREVTPSTEHMYDAARQLWISASSGVPVVVEACTQQASKFGETTITESKEGTDQDAIGILYASKFGETQMTKTSEGHDQSGEVVQVSRFGETSETATGEGSDVPRSTTELPHVAFGHF